MRALICAVAVGFLLCSAASAGPARVQMGLGSYRLGNGGEFTYTRVSGDFLPGAQSGISFCVELDETFNPGGQYYTRISNSADNGGLGGPDPDPLDPRTASVFKQWFTEANPTNTLAGTYQLAIWWLEEEIIFDVADNRWEPTGSNSSLGGGAFNAISWATVDALILSVGVGDLSGVAIMQLWDNWSSGGGYSGARQDQIILVPLPGAALLGVLGLSIAGWMKRRTD